MPSFLNTKITYKGGLDTDAEEEFYEELGEQISAKWWDSSQAVQTKIRTIQFSNLTTNQRRKLAKIAKDTLPQSTKISHTTISKYK